MVWGNQNDYPNLKLTNEILIMSVTIKELKKHPTKSIFDMYPNLLGIWSDPEHKQNANESIREWEENDKETGKVYLILWCGAVAGIIGFWEVSKYKVGIRWSGILSIWQGKNVYKQALDLMMQANDKYTFWYECAYSKKALDYFCHIGFSIVMCTETANAIRGSEGSDDTTVLVLPNPWAPVCDSNNVPLGTGEVIIFSSVNNIEIYKQILKDYYSTPEEVLNKLKVIIVPERRINQLLKPKRNRYTPYTEAYTKLLNEYYGVNSISILFRTNLIGIVHNKKLVIIRNKLGESGEFIL